MAKKAVSITAVLIPEKVIPMPPSDDQHPQRPNTIRKEELVLFVLLEDGAIWEVHPRDPGSAYRYVGDVGDFS